jgi:4-diphosphocytidyl-2C-methyl-D-erythritol kinase
MTTERAAGARIHVVRFAPAKLNLTLAVVGRREDGYHSLHSIMVPLSLGDALTASASASPPGAVRDSLRVSGLALSSAPDNLVLRAIAAAREVVAATWPGGPADPPPLAARLAKRIPVAAGLGGGSRSAALITGRGERVEPLPEIHGEPPAVLLVTPQVAVATAAVFGAYATGARGSDARAAEISEHLAAEMRGGGLTSAALVVRAAELAGANDLRAATSSVVPGLAGFLTALEKLLDRPVCQSGSGPTLWTLYPTLAEARKAARFVRLGAVNGTLPLVGTGEPFIAATTIAARYAPPSAEPPGRTTGTIRPRTVHNGFDAGRDGPARPAAEPTESKGDALDES